MTDREQHVQQEILTARDENILDALRMAAGGLVGVSVEVLSDPKDDSEAFEAAEIAEAVDDSERVRRVFATKWALRQHDSGGVTRNSYTAADPNVLRNLYAWRAIGVLLSQGKPDHMKRYPNDDSYSPETGDVLDMRAGVAKTMADIGAYNPQETDYQKNKALKSYKHYKGARAAVDVYLDMMPYDINN